MEIIKATSGDRDKVLAMLEDFSAAILRLKGQPLDQYIVPGMALRRELFDQVIGSETTGIFLAKENGECAGIITIHLVPQLRKGKYYAEIEEMYVREEFQGKGIASQLIEAVVTWAREKRVELIRLQSAKELVRAHAFYRKMGFEEPSVAFKKTIK